MILMSARPDQPEIAQAVSQGDVARFIAKPFDVDELTPPCAWRSSIAGDARK